MMIPEFMRFYNYTAAQALDEFATTFFALINSMNRIKAREAMQHIVNTAAAQAGKEATNVLDDLRKQERGLSGIVEEVRNIKR